MKSVPSARRRTLGAELGASPATVRSPAALGHGGCGFCLGGQRASGHRARDQTRGSAAAGALVGGPTGASAATLVSAGAALAYGLRRAYPGFEATARALPLPLSRRGRDGTLGGTGSARQ